MGEVFPETLFCDVVPGSLVHITHPVARLCGGNAAKIGFLDDFVDFPLPVADGTQKHCPGHVGAVVLPPSADVQHHTVAGLSSGVVGDMVGVRPVAAEGGNGFEGIALISRFQIEFQQEIPQLFFRMVLPQNADDPGHDSVIVPGSSPHLLLLGRGLDGPDPIDDGRGIDALAVHQLLEPKQESSRPVFIHSQRLFCGKIFRHKGRAVLGVVIIGDGRSQVPGLAEQVVDEEPVVSVGLQQQHQHPLSRLYPLAGQVEDHRRIRDQQLADVLLFHGGQNV